MEVPKIYGSSQAAACLIPAAQVATALLPLVPTCGFFMVAG